MGRKKSSWTSAEIKIFMFLLLYTPKYMNLNVLLIVVVGDMGRGRGATHPFVKNSVNMRIDFQT